MKCLFIYIKSLLINLFIVTIISGILIAIFPHVIILLAWIILVIGSFINVALIIEENFDIKINFGIEKIQEI